MRLDLPRIVVAGLSGGGGKTLVSVGLAAALRERGIHVLPFKKGPDYIDAAWLSRAAGAPCYNLDTFLMGQGGVLESIGRHARPSSGGGARAPRLALIEGNRGLFDGLDEKGATSTAELARLLDAPVILVVDCTKTTRTVCAMIEGCRAFDPHVRLAGVILNRLGGKRHEDVIRASLATSCRLPVLGAVPRLAADPFPERHLGLVTPQDHPDDAVPVTSAFEAARGHLELDRILDIARTAEPLRLSEPGHAVSAGGSDVRPAVGILRDAAFSFYYPDNIEALEDLGARIVEISALDDTALPDVDALYLGGGFPETHAGLLAGNDGFKASLREAVERGLPVYAECGGALYAGRSLTYEGSTYPMAGILPLDFQFFRRPLGHGYTILETVGRNPFFSTGTEIRGHEFHYSGPCDFPAGGLEPLFKVRKGHGMDGRFDGISYRNLIALYTHVHASGTGQWAGSMMRLATAFSCSKSGNEEHKPSKKGLKNFSCLSI